jgi:hypothetical protein
VQLDPLGGDRREQLVQVVVTAAARQRALVDDARRAAGGLGQGRRQVAGEREVRVHAGVGGQLVARGELAEQHVGDGDEARAALDGSALELVGVARVREAVLVRRAAKAVHVVHVVDDRHVRQLEREHGQRIGQVVGVHQVRLPLREHALET